MDEVNVCPQCGGTGWRIVEREGLSGAERCECVLRERPAHLLGAAGIPPHYRNASFENFSTRPDHPQAHSRLQYAAITARKYADEFGFPSRKRGLLFIGDPGTGKTHLAVSVIRRLIANGHEAVFFDYQNLLERIRSTYDPASGGANRDAYRKALECEVLVLDDLGAHRVSDWVEDTITSIITHRCNHDRALIATTNLRDPEAGDAPVPGGVAGDTASRYYLAERVGTRARSRLFEMCFVVSTRGVDDYRKVKTGAGVTRSS
jgi:DNA replication protein DnaC